MDTTNHCQTCDGCYRRKGALVFQDAMPAQRSMMPPIMEPWVFRYYLCPWCRGVWNRRRVKGQKRLTVKEWKPDSEVLAEQPATCKEVGDG